MPDPISGLAKDTPVRLVGFDSGGEAFLFRDRVWRGIYPGQGRRYRQVLQTCEQHDLFRRGIVATQELPPQPDFPYEVILEHERLPFITYPQEWPASMLKDAALFHIDLFLELGKYELTIKDWHPYNILFKNTSPVFVDFTSIIPLTELPKEAYLTPPTVPRLFRRRWDTLAAYFYAMYQRMYVPYFLLFLSLMSRGRHAQARKIMAETILNASTRTITASEVFPVVSPHYWQYRWREFQKKVALADPDPRKPRFFLRLREEVTAMPVSLQASGYSDYYQVKAEDFAFEPNPAWQNKQRVVYEMIRRWQPATLLDLGCNTGWFSILATGLGCNVVATDIDETCVDLLYNRAKNENLAILPLVMNIAQPINDTLALTYADEPNFSLLGGEAPILLATAKRLKCDMVLALGIVHHLALGQGIGFQEIIKLLKEVTRNNLVVEFIARDDELIAAEPAFFPAFAANPQQFGWYFLDNFIEALSGHFSQIEIKKSHPESRVIIICTI